MSLRLAPLPPDQPSQDGSSPPGDARGRLQEVADALAAAELGSPDRGMELLIRLARLIREAVRETPLDGVAAPSGHHRTAILPAGHPPAVLRPAQTGVPGHPPKVVAPEVNSPSAGGG